MNNKVGRNDLCSVGVIKNIAVLLSINLFASLESATTVDFSWLNLCTGGEI